VYKRHLLGMAAHLEGKGCGIVDMTGMAQKGGAVTSHIMLAERPDDIAAIRIPPGRADLVLGCDLVVSAGDQLLKLVNPARGRIVVNSHEMITGAFTRDPDFKLPVNLMQARMRAAVPDGAFLEVDASRIATALMGDSIAANLFMLGVAYQKGLIPLSAAAIERAIELNGVAIPLNRQAFAWGRLWVQNPGMVGSRAGLDRAAMPKAPSLEALVARRVEDLTAYQDARYAARFKALVDRVAAVDSGSDKALTRAVAESLHKLMAYKDEYEVARLYSDGRFNLVLRSQFSGDFRLRLHLAPPIFSRRDPHSGHLVKRDFGPWVLRLMPLLAKLKGLRGTAFDPFGYSAERKAERALIEDYEATLDTVLAALPEADYATAVELASIPLRIRGFGHIKKAAMEAAAEKRRDLLARLRAPEAALRDTG